MIVLPGSHSKWVKVDGDRVVAFRPSYGRIVRGAADHTVAGACQGYARQSPEKRSRSAFAAALRGSAKESPACLPSCLGLVRCRSGALPDDDAGEYLSGLLIGAEIGEARRLFPGETPYVAGAEALVERYLAAFAALNVSARAAPRRAAARGLFRIARAGGLL